MTFNVFGGSIEPGQSFRSDWWSWPDGRDNGLQYFAVHPLDPNAKLVTSEQNRTLGANGRSYYGFRITNEGPYATLFNVQGGYFNQYDHLDRLTIQAGESLRKDGISLIGCSDGGVLIASARPRNPNATLTISDENMQLGADGCWYYGCRITNEGSDGTSYDLLIGGGFSHGFNVPDGTIEVGQSFREDGWSWPNGTDHGAQYFAPHPSNPNAKLVVSEQNKQLGVDGRWYYGFRITNEGPEATFYTVQGGGFH